MKRKMMTCNFPLLSMFDKILTTAKRRQQWSGFSPAGADPDRPGIGNELSDYCFQNGKIVTVG